MNVVTRPLHALGLCDGIGALGLGLRLALGEQYRLVGAVERDAYAAAVLVARMEDQTLDQAAIWDDLTTFDGEPWRGRVDLIHAGFPCQPASQAGARRGLDDERWLWPQVARVVREVGPSLVFLENVPGLLSVNGGRAMREVLGDLAALGFDIEWTCLSAAAVGASQLRERLWLLAHRNDRGLPELRRQPADHGNTRHDADGPGGPDVADPVRTGRQEVPGGASGDEGPDARRETHGGHVTDGDGEALAHTNRSRRGPGVGSPDPRTTERSEPEHAHINVADPAGPGHEGRVHGAPQRRPGPARPGESLPLWPPGPDDRPAWDRISAADGPQPAVRRMADGPTSRLDRLHALGNSVVPLVAASAFLGLTHRAGLIEAEVTA